MIRIILVSVMIMTILLGANPFLPVSAQEEVGWVELNYFEPVLETYPGGEEHLVEVRLYGPGVFESVKVNTVPIQSLWHSTCVPNSGTNWVVGAGEMLRCYYPIWIEGNAGDERKDTLDYNIDGQSVSVLEGFVYADVNSHISLWVNAPQTQTMDPGVTSQTFTFDVIVDVRNYSLTDHVRIVEFDLEGADSSTCEVGGEIEPGGFEECFVTYTITATAPSQVFSFSVGVEAEDDDGLNPGDILTEEWPFSVLILPGVFWIPTEMTVVPVFIDRIGWVTYTVELTSPGASSYRVNAISDSQGSLNQVCGIPDDGIVVNWAHPFECTWRRFTAAGPGAYQYINRLVATGVVSDSRPARGEASATVQITLPYQLGINLPLILGN